MRPAGQAFVPAFAQPVYPAYMSPVFPGFLGAPILPPVPSQLTQSCAVPGQGYGLIGQQPCSAPSAPYAPYGVYPAGQAATPSATSPWLAGAIGVAIGAIGMHFYMR